MPIQRIAAVLDLQGTVSRSLGRATQRTARALEGITRKTKELKRESDRLSKLRVAEEKKYGRALEETRRKINQVSRALREQQRAEELLRARQRRAARMERVRAGAGRAGLAAGVGGAFAFRGLMRREDVAGLAASRGLGSVQPIIADLMRRFRVREEQAAAAVAASIEGGDRTMQSVTQRARRGMMLAAGGVGRIEQAPMLTDALSRFEDAFDRTLTMPEVSALGAALNTTNVEISTLSTMLNKNTAVITSMGGPQAMAETVIAAQLGGFTKPGRFLQTLLDTLTRARISGKGRFVEGTFGQGASTNPQLFLRGAMQFIDRHGEDRALEAFREMAFTERVSDITKFGRALANNTEEARRRIAGFSLEQASGAFAGARPATGAIVSWQAQLTELMGHTAEALAKTNPALDRLNKWLDSVGSGGFWAAALGGVTLVTALKMGAAGALFRGAVAAAGIAFGATLGVRGAAGAGAQAAAAAGGRRGGSRALPGSPGSLGARASGPLGARSAGLAAGAAGFAAWQAAIARRMANTAGGRRGGSRALPGSPGSLGARASGPLGARSAGLAAGAAGFAAWQAAIARRMANTAGGRRGGTARPPGASGSLAGRGAGARAARFLLSRAIPGVGTALMATDAATALWAARHDVRLSPEDLLAARQRERQGTAHGRMAAITHPLADADISPMSLLPPMAVMSRHGRRVFSASGSSRVAFRTMGRHGRRAAPRSRSFPPDRAGWFAGRHPPPSHELLDAVQGLPEPARTFGMGERAGSGLTITIVQQPGEGDDSTLDRAMQKMREWMRSEREDRFASEFGFDPTAP